MRHALIKEPALEKKRVKTLTFAAVKAICAIRISFGTLIQNP